MYMYFSFFNYKFVIIKDPERTSRESTFFHFDISLLLIVKYTLILNLLDFLNFWNSPLSVLGITICEYNIKLAS